jgi:RND family efflux transporter MFP subunit
VSRSIDPNPSNEETSMQPIPFTKRKVAHTIQSTVGRRLIAAAVGLTVVGTATLVSSSQDSARSTTDAAMTVENKAARTAGVTVSLIVPVSAQFARGLSATGTIAPRDELVIGSDAAGVRLTEVLVEVGAVVQRGQLLARGDDSLLRAELAQREAGIRQAQAELAQAQDNLDRAERVKDSGVYSAEQLQTRRHNALAAQAKVELAQAQRRELEVRIAQTRVFAPSAGVVSKKTATVGAVMQPGNELFRLIKDGQLEWLAELPAHAMAQVQPGASARIRLDGSEPVDATVRLVAPTLDAGTRNGLVYVALPRGTPIKAGTHAKGEIVVAQAQGVALPEAAVITRDGYPYVFVVGADSVARMKRIETGARLRGMVEVVSGLTAGDAVVGTGAGFVKDGETVRIAPVPAINADAKSDATQKGA